MVVVTGVGGIVIVGIVGCGNSGVCVWVGTLLLSGMAVLGQRMWWFWCKGPYQYDRF